MPPTGAPPAGMPPTGMPPTGMPPTGMPPTGMPGMQPTGPSVTPGFGGGNPFPGAPLGGYNQQMFSEQSQATTALVLSIIGLFCCGFPAAVGVALGTIEKKAITAGRRDPGNRGQTDAALAVGIIGCLLWGLFYLGVIADFINLF